MYADKITDSMDLAINETPPPRDTDAVQRGARHTAADHPQGINDIKSYVTDEMGSTTAEQV